MTNLEDRVNLEIKYISNDTSHPDVADGAPIKIFVTEFKETMEKDQTFIPIARTGDERDQGAKTLLLDFLETNENWTITGKVYNGKDGKYSLPNVFRDSNDDGAVTGSDDPDTITVNQNLTFAAHQPSGDAHEWHNLGATKIKYDSEVVENTTESKTLTRGTHYEMDYNRGLIELIDDGTTDTDLSDSYKIGYTYSGRNDNIGRIIKRMSERGGTAELRIEPTTYTQEDRSIVAVDQANDFFSISGDKTSDYNKGDTVNVNGSTGNDGDYKVLKATYDSNNDETDVYVGSDIPDSTADGNLTKKQPIQHMVGLNTVEFTQNAENFPGEVEVSIDARVGTLRS